MSINKKTMDRDIIKRILLENQEIIFKKKIVKRNYIIPKTDNISVLIGIRRCGKTHTLYEKAQEFEKELILFLDFEDERLIALNTLSSYDIIIDSYKSLFPDKKPIIFFDEIQNLKNWHFYLKRLHVSGYEIFVTGSNAYLISKDIATYLKGRSIETRIHPFSFKEFLRLKNVHISKEDYFINKHRILNFFDEYLDFGGFPEVIKAENDNKRLIAQNIYNLLFYKDLVSKYNKDDYLLKLIVNKITENITKEFSITNLSKKIMTVIKSSVPTITDYFSILPEPFLTTNIYQYRTSFIARQSKRKTYLNDNSFIFLNRINTDKSRLFENLIFNYLQREYSNIFYYKTSNNKEVDFFINNTEKLLIQASYSLDNDETKAREIKSLFYAMKEQNIKTAYIYSYNTEEEMSMKNSLIKIVPFWKILLE